MLSNVHRLIVVTALAATLSACTGSSQPQDASVDALGDASISDIASDAPVPSSGNIVQLAGGRYFSCARTRDRALYCWGQGAYRQLGGDYGFQGMARRVDAIYDAVELDCGDRFTCAIRSTGAVWCWGDDDHKQAGEGPDMPCGDSTIDSVCAVVPRAIAGLPSDAPVQLALGNEHACARLATGVVWCWGNGTRGQIGDGSLADNRAPTLVAGLTNVSQVATGDEHTCAIVGSPGQVFCWGADDSGQVGNGAVTDNVPMPTRVGTIDDAVEVSAGGEHTCVRHASGSVSCWGYDYFGQLGNGSTRPTRATSPQAVMGLNDAAQLGTGRYHTCARRTDGTVVCWGYNARGQLGDGTMMDRSVPTPVAGLDGVTFASSSNLHDCVALARGGAVCWGDGLGGQLGDNRQDNHTSTSPVVVMGLPTQ